MACWFPSFHINSKQVFVLNTSRLPSHWFALKKVIFVIVIGCGLDLFLIRGLILQICVLSHSEPRHTIANQKPNYKDFGIYRKIKKESCLCVVAKMTFKGQETARKQHRDMTLILPFYRSYDKFRQNLYNLALSGLLSVWAPCGYFSQYIL